MGLTDSPHAYLSRHAQRERDEVIRLHYAADMHTREVASMLGLGKNTVCHALRRAGATLRRPGWKRWDEMRLRRSHDGYWQVRLRPHDPMIEMADRLGWVKEHRLIVARALGRPLRPDEQVHHRDGDRANNEPGNLQLRQGNHGQGRVIRCAACGSHDVEFAEL